MAFTDLFNGMNIFGARAPEYLVGSDTATGLLDEAAKEKLKNQALLQGLLGAGATYLSMPKNQRYGSALPYLGKAYLGGMQASQGAYDVAGKNYLDQQNQANINNLLKDPRIANDPILKTLVSSGKVKEAADIINPSADKKLEEYTSAYYPNKKYADLTPTEKQDVLQKVASASRMTIDLGSPVAGVDAQGNPVFFQASKTGGAPSIVSGVVPKAGEAQTKQIMGIENTQRAIGDYKEALKTWSPTDAIDPVKRAEMGTYYNNMMLQAKEAYNLGVLNGNDYKILTDVIADPNSAKGVAYATFGALDKQADALNRIMEKMKTGMQGKTTSSINKPATPSKKLTDEELQNLYLPKKP